MSTYEANYTHKISSQKIGWYGHYTKESLDFCDAYSFDVDVDSVESLFGISSVDDSYYGASASTVELTCGSGVVLYTNKRTPNLIEDFHYGYLDTPTDEEGQKLPPLLIRPPHSNFEKFEIKFATDNYKQVEGTYKLTDIFKEGHPVYKNSDNGWHILYKDGRFRLVNKLVNFTDGLTGQRNKPNGIFISEDSNTDYAIAEGVEQLTQKLCKVNARYTIRKSTGAYFEKKKELYLTPRTPRSLDEKTITETSTSEYPTHLLIDNFILSSNETDWIKYETIIKSQITKNDTLTLTYKASVSDECGLTTPTKEEYINNGTHIDNLVERISPAYMISETVIDEPIQGKTFTLSDPPEIVSEIVSEMVGEVEGERWFHFKNSESRNNISIPNSAGSNAFNSENGYSIYIRFKPTSHSATRSVILSKWSQTQGFVSPTSSFKLFADGWQVNEDVSVKRFSDFVNKDQWHNLMVTQNPETNELKIYINNQKFEYNDFPDMIVGNHPVIVGGFFTDVNQFEGFDGLISDVRIYSRPLESEYVDTIFDKADFESNKEQYKIPTKYELKNNLYMTPIPSEKLKFHKSSYVPIQTITHTSTDLSTMIVGELNETQSGDTSLTLNVYIKNNNKWEFSFEKYTTEYNNFYYCKNRVVLKNDTFLELFEIDTQRKQFSRKSKIRITSATNIEPILFETEYPVLTEIPHGVSSGGSFFGLQQLLKYNVTSSTGIFLLVVDQKYKISVYDASGSFRLISESGIPSDIKNRIAQGINKITICDQHIIVFGVGGMAYFMRIENNRLTWVGFRNIPDSLDMTDLKLIKNHDNEYRLLTIHRGAKIANHDEKYTVAKNADLDTGYIKVKKINLYDHKTIYSIDFGRQDQLAMELLQTITPPYSEFGTELLENSSFGDNITTSGDNLFISSPSAFKNEDGSSVGIVYWYKWSNELSVTSYQETIETTSSNESLELEYTTGMRIENSAQKIKRISGQPGWNAQVFSNKSFTGGCILTFVPDTTKLYASYGINQNPTHNADWDSIDYSIILSRTGQYSVHESGSEIKSTRESYSSGDIFKIVYDNTKVQYFRNNVIFYTSMGDVDSNKIFYFDSSFNDVSTTLFYTRSFSFTALDTSTNDGGEDTNSSGKYVFVSRIFDTSPEGRKDFGNKMSVYENKIFIQSSYLDDVKSGDELWFGQVFNFENNISEQQLKNYDLSTTGFDMYDAEFKLEVWYRFNEIYSYSKQTRYSREKYMVLDHSGNYNHLNCYFKISPRREEFKGPLEGDMTYRFEKSSHANVNLNLSNTSFTLNLWYLVENFDDDQSVLLSMYDSENINSEKGFVMYSNGNFMTGTNLNIEPLEVAIVNEVNTWNMITVIYDHEEKQVKFYKNTILKKTLQNIDIQFDNNIMSIGGLTYTKNPFYGYLDDLKIYKKQLNDEDISYEFKKSWKFQWMKT
jgi:hypothetical protein